ncbi:restriction endonuclease [Puia dinghuensis]|uniref:Restriction endonuclease n=1 Tax=Puia dinghuensis TaxID=1792502 RepID=A0A8J2UJ07_9BACT|nr:restriction endonuclease [Puia dinghuensis]GGB24824.1 restriction endonuclease [Puia dinghuensis]
MTEEEKTELLPSGNQPVIDNRVGWARTYLKNAQLLENPRRGILKISEAGKQLLDTRPQRIDIRYLNTLPGFKEWRESSSAKEDESGPVVEKTEIETGKTPEELLEYSFISIKEQLASELLEKVKSCPPVFFEILVIDLLIRMGYGGSRKEAGQVIGRSGDGGIDGLIKEDKLGLDTIYVQTKRWGNQVTIHQVRDFAGSLLGRKAKKGILISTSSYPASAKEFVTSIEPKIVLIDGKELAELMIEYNIGVAPKKTYEVKRLDTDYFEEV